MSCWRSRTCPAPSKNPPHQSGLVPDQRLTVRRCRFKNVLFDILPGPETGTFLVKARFLGVEMEEFLLRYQVEPRPVAHQPPCC